MRRRDGFKLDLISSIHNDVIERQTKKRIKLLLALEQKRSKKRLGITVGSIAAMLAIVVGLIPLLFGSLFKQVPIYTGMTVSAEAPQALLFAPDRAQDASVFEPLSAQYALADLPHNKHNAPSVSGGPGGKVQDSLPVVDGKNSLYYANPNESIYITVHIENPDDFEILSFTLNGEKYSSYMFEPGSDMENIVLKVEVGQTKAVIEEYTIDAIKYVDGTRIKDVHMKGDKTVRIGIRGSIQPTASIATVTKSYNSASLQVTLHDQQGLIALTDGYIMAVLTQNGETVSSEYLTVESINSLQYENLLPNTTYELSICAVYDPLSGNGRETFVLANQSFTTDPVLTLQIGEITRVSASFSVMWNERYAERNLQGFQVYQGTEKIADLPANATEITKLLPGSEYTLVATILHNGVVMKNHKTNFTTEEIPYTVNHYVENSNDSEYTLKETQTLYAGVAPVEVPIQIWEGYIPPETQTISINADGSTVVSYYYKCETYQVSFVSNGGSSVASGTYKYGQRLPASTRQGSTFGGWGCGSNFNSAELTMPATSEKSVTLYAWWQGETMPFYIQMASQMSEKGALYIETVTQSDVVIPQYIEGKLVTAVHFLGVNSSTGGIESLTINFAPNVSNGEIVADYGLTTLKHLTIGGNVGSVWLTNFTVLQKIEIKGTVKHLWIERCTTLQSMELSGDTDSVSFRDCTALQSVVLEDGITSVSFDGCTALKNVVLGDSITHASFGGCKNLESVVMGDGMRQIPNFEGCSSLKSIVIGKNVNTIFPNNFKDCTALSSVTFEDPYGWCYADNWEPIDPLDPNAALNALRSGRPLEKSNL